ncbi:MAG: type III-A CRISPR-associated CARF protein Csm6 [Chordicoccus sp.]
MNEVILFSPIGGTDPISNYNCYDGSMLHIARHYQPTRIILYMSKLMLEWQAEDDRYRYALSKLFEMQGRTGVEIKEIERPELTDVQEFDFFYKEFRTILMKIREEMDDSDQLLINVSSGTPAMKSGLLVLQTLGEIPSKTIQVITPARDINNHIHKDYDVKTLWELDPDNEPDAQNRCKEVHCPTLSRMEHEEMIRQHVSVYDYEAALTVADSMPGKEELSYRNLLEFGRARLQLDFPRADSLMRKIGVDFYPIKTGNEKMLFEYALGLDIRNRRGEYADFIRAITPILADLFKLALKKQCSLNISDYTNTSEGKESWDEKKLVGTNVLRILEDAYQYRRGFQYGYVKSDHLLNLICGFSDDDTLKSLMTDLHSVEEKIRNIAAHQIVSITEEKIRKMTGFTPNQIMEKIKRLFSYTSIHVKKEDWNSYDELNEQIFKAMHRF